ncbi:MAG: hypothetical protein ACRDE7_06350 [Sphingobacterium sp.]
MMNMRDIHIFNVSQLDVEQWVISAKKVGDTMEGHLFRNGYWA